MTEEIAELGRANSPRRRDRWPPDIRMRASSRHFIVFGATFLVSLALFHRPLLAALLLSLRNDEYTQILLILPVSVALILLEWGSLNAKPTWSPRTGLVLGAAALLIAIGSLLKGSFASDSQLFVSVLALVVLWIGAFVFCFGAEIARSVLFPLCFLFLMVPIPSSVLLTVVQWLQRGSAFIAWALFSGTHVPVIRDGVQLTIPGLTIEVAQECSSIRSSLMLLVTTMVLAHLLLRSPWKKLLVVLLAIPLSVAKNGLRIFTIAMLGTRVDRGYLTGHLHRDGGVVFFLIAIAAIVLTIAFLRRGETAESIAASPTPARS